MEWIVGIPMFVIGIGILLAYSNKACEAELLAHTCEKQKKAIWELTTTTAHQEPTRMDANDPLRDRFVFCGSWPERGHAKSCPWVALMQIEAEPVS